MHNFCLLCFYQPRITSREKPRKTLKYQVDEYGRTPDLDPHVYTILQYPACLLTEVTLKHYCKLEFVPFRCTEADRGKRLNTNKRNKSSRDKFDCV